MHRPRASGRPEEDSAKWSIFYLPWICSSITHVVVLLLLFALFPERPGASRQNAVSTGITVTAISVDQGSDMDGGSGGGDLEAEPAGKTKYFDEEPAAPTPPSPLLATSTPAPNLSDVIGAQPPVNLEGVLPRVDPNAAIGASALANREGTPGGVGQGGAAHGGGGAPGSGRYLRGGKARTGVFGLQGEGYKFVYVFDRSGSMDGHGGAPLRGAKEQLIASIANLGDTHQFQIVFYNEQPRVFAPAGRQGRLVFATDQNKNQALKFIASITADGATEHEGALAMALRMAPDVVFFLTDADEPRLTAEQLARIRRLNRGSSINTIEFGYGVQMDADNFLVQLAHQNGGKHIYVDISQLVQAAAALTAAGQPD